MPILSIALALAAAAAPQKAPREQSPVPREVVAPIGAGNSDDEIARQIAAADAHPLGTAANPIRVGGPEGARAYLAGLRCGDGKSPQIGAARQGGVGAFGSLLQLYPIDCGSAAPGRVELNVDQYQEEHKETRPPAGFQLRR
ncbi:MAG TPA: hypothetical protein VF662_00825 [Allosphingosinicella sp.]|jgi:hypothetical protein